MSEPALNLELLGLLQCPQCRAALSVNGADLVCEECGGRFPVVRGVPRLAGEAYAESFGRQWNRYDVARTDEDEATFQAKTGVHPRELAGLRVLDAGCGGGRYSRLVGSHGASVLGVDLSTAVDKASTLCAELPNVQIVQADLLDLPVAESAFDMAFSIGVLHHTPDPRRAFAQVARRVRLGGRLSVWLYRRNTPPQEWLNSGLRAVTTRTPTRVLEPLCAALGVFGSAPVLNRTLNKIVNFSAHPDWTLRVCDNFDWWAPKYQSHHTVDELSSWFVDEGFDEVVELAPEKSGGVYRWVYEHNLVVGSGVNVTGVRRG